MERVLVTGYPGAIGAALVKHLLNEGTEVIAVVRAQKDRVVAPQKGLRVIYADITDPDLSVEKFLGYGRIDVVIHAAGLVQYRESLRELTFRTNVEGTQNILRIARQLDIARFVYISTAYVSGTADHFGEDELGYVPYGANPYIESKVEAEKLVRAYPGDALIIRLSTVIGDVKTGEIGRPGGYSGFVGPFFMMRGKLSLYPDEPFWMGVNRETSMNLETREWTVDMTCRAAFSRISGTIHLTHPHPVNMGFLFEETFRRNLGLPLTTDRVESERMAPVGDTRWLRLQGSVSNWVKYFGTFVQHDTVYGRTRAMTVPGYIDPPEITSSVIKIQVDYMKRRLFARTRRLTVKAA